MFKVATHQLRRQLLIWTMSLALLGVQCIQNSALHDHAQHTVDCALCHFQLGDDSAINTALAQVFIAFASHVSPPAAQVFISLAYPAYQGRAPPLPG